MILKVFSTKREIREFVKKHQNTFLPKMTTIGEFLEKSIIVKNASLIDGDLKKIYLYKALQNIDIARLGLKKDFLNFFKNSEFIISFFNEIYLEKTSIEDIQTADTYLEYSEHLEVLKEIYREYKKLLEKNSLYDKTVVENFDINRKFFENITRVEIHLSGYLPKLDMEIIKKIPVPVEMIFRVTPYNRTLINKMFGEFENGEYRFDVHRNEIIQKAPLPKRCRIEVQHFSNRINQASFVFASIEEMVKEGIKPENIAVILPDESYSRYLKLMDVKNNLNFAMGESFEMSEIYITLEAVYNYIVQKDALSYRKVKNKIEEFQKCKGFEDVLEFVLKNAAPKERKLLDEEIYKISRLKELKNYTNEEILHFLLERFKNLTFDDVKGGKVTVMGVLESRGMNFEGVVIVDFNDEYVPNVSDKDFFLNSIIRKRSKLPTRADKEALQKNYYYNILLNAKKAKISYVKNEEKEPSRFLYELGIGYGTNRDEYYSQVLYKTGSPVFYEYEGSFELPEILTPTKLKTVLECPLKYYFSYVLKIQNAEKKEYFGNRFHTAIQNVLKQLPLSADEYFQRLMAELLKNTSKREYFEIKSQWEEKIREFTHKDFQLLTPPVVSEPQLPAKKYKKFVLQARADRITGNRIYDYKTSKNQDYLKDSVQAEIYRFLVPGSEIYFWDIYNVKLIKVEPDIKNLEKKLDSVPTSLKRAENPKTCQYCEYKFACLHFES